MKVIKIDKKDWAGGLGKLSDAYRLFGPVKDKDVSDFKELAAGELPDFDFLNTNLSAKSAVFPQNEVMFEYSLDESQEDHHIMKEPEKDYSPRAVIGIRPCDAAAFLLVKRNFDTPEYKDPYWIRAYEASTFVGLACNDPGKTCFCTTAGCGPFHEDGLDVLIADAGDHFLAKAITEKGEALLQAAGWGAEADGGQIETMKKAAEAKISSTVSTDSLKDKVTTELYDASFWEDTAFACLNCGTCTYVCPTCWCFDIQDENYGKAGIRMRNWDSCMYPLFTIHGSGHNPRGTKTQRVRQRFMHKLKYYVDKYGAGIQCVGCGRCVRLCPVNIDIREVCEFMNSYDPAATTCKAA
ncbi:4Fe-4S dicluster domain-containing protein [Desulfococcaceae bacterium HSG8]|nr:4Fe-4S dicluster domain-containing protein [Desulfococcaceae bacterium HSG8]